MASLIQYASGAPGIKYTLDKTSIMIGRCDTGADICLPCSFASKRHARIEALPSLEKAGEYAFYIEDLGSTNHTFVNDKATRRTRLHHGDVIKIGKVTFRFDATGDTIEMETVDVELEPQPPLQSQSKTLSFSRRLNSFGE